MGSPLGKQQVLALRTIALMGGEVVDRSGRATSRLADRMGIDVDNVYAVNALSGSLHALEKRGWVERSVKGKRTSRIALTDEGRKVVSDPNIPDRAIVDVLSEMLWLDYKFAGRDVSELISNVADRLGRNRASVGNAMQRLVRTGVARRVARGTELVFELADGSKVDPDLLDPNVLQKLRNIEKQDAAVKVEVEQPEPEPVVERVVDDRERPVVHTPGGDDLYSPEEVAAYLLAQVIDKATAESGKDAEIRRLRDQVSHLGNELVEAREKLNVMEQRVEKEVRRANERIQAALREAEEYKHLVDAATSPRGRVAFKEVLSEDKVRELQRLMRELPSGR